jgi:hypothetical protein
LVALLSKKIRNVTDFRNSFSVPLRDFNTAGVVSAHVGHPLSQMSQKYYSVHGGNVEVNADQIKECETAVDNLLAFIN